MVAGQLGSLQDTDVNAGKLGSLLCTALMSLQEMGVTARY
jgi:hypothetical protein